MDDCERARAPQDCSRRRSVRDSAVIRQLWLTGLRAHRRVASGLTAVACFALSVSYVYPTEAPLGPGQAALLIGGGVGELDVARLAELAGDPRPLARGTAARLAAVGGYRSLAPALFTALEKETDAVAAREQIRALAIVSGHEADEALFRAAARFSGALDSTLARSVSLRGTSALGLVSRLSRLELTEADWEGVAAWITASAKEQLGSLAAAVLSTGNESAWAAVLSLTTKEKRALGNDSLAQSLAEGKEPVRELTYSYLLSLDHGAPAEGSLLARALAATPEARDEGGPVARLGYELVGRQFGRSPRNQTELIAALDPSMSQRLPVDLRALRQLRGDEVQAYSRVLYGDDDVLAEYLKGNEKNEKEGKPREPTAVAVRTISDFVPDLAEDILAAANCRIKGTPWAFVEIRHDAAGRRAAIGNTIPPELSPECQRAARAILLSSLVPPKRPARPMQTDVLLLPLYSSFLECVRAGRKGPSTVPAHIGGRITAPRKKRGEPPIYPRAARRRAKAGRRNPRGHHQSARVR